MSVGSVSHGGRHAMYEEAFVCCALRLVKSGREFVGHLMSGACRLADGIYVCVYVCVCVRGREIVGHLWGREGEGGGERVRGAIGACRYIM